MNLEQMKDKYTELITANDKHETDMIDKISLKHGMRLTIHYVISLGNYLDYLSGMGIDDDGYFLAKHNEAYNISTDCQNRSNDIWDTLSGVVV